jgi:hypothetical protein
VARKIKAQRHGNKRDKEKEGYNAVIRTIRWWRRIYQQREKRKRLHSARANTM